MTHGDDDGLILPPAIAPVQVVIVPLAHMGGWCCWEEVPELLADTPALLDTAFSLRPAEAEEGDQMCIRDRPAVRLP